MPILAGILLVISVIAITWGALEPRLAPPDEYGFDKFVHMGAFGFLVILAAVARPKLSTLIAAPLVMVVLGVGIEIAQSYVPNRTASAADALADAAGAFIAAGLAWGVWRYNQK